MRSLYQRGWVLLLVAALALSPAALLAQAVSPDARAAIINGAAAGASLIAVTGDGATVTPPVEIEVDIPEIDEPEVDEPEIDEPEVDEPEVDEPEIDEPEIDEPEIDEPEIDEPEVIEDDPGPDVVVSGDLVEYENVGLTILAPAEWDVMATTMFDNLFTMEVPDTEFVGLVQGGESLDFPGVMAVIIMRLLPEFIVAQFGEGAELLNVETLVSPQDLPVVKIEFNADLEGMNFSGAFYVVSPGSTAYIMIGLAPAEQWADFAPGMDAVASSIEFAPELLTLEFADNEAIYVVDTEETLEIVLPAGWQASATGDPALPILTVAPGYEFVAALTASREMADEVVALLDETLVDGEVDDEILDLVMDLMWEAMALDQEMLNLDPAFNEIFVVRDELVLRLVGSMTIDEGVEMPAGIYVGLRRDGISALIVFGEMDEILAQEATLVDILDSLLFIR